MNTVSGSGGNSLTCYKTPAGVTCWGFNDQGQLGRGNTLNIGAAATDMTNLGVIGFSPTLGPIAEVSAGSAHACVLTYASQILCWGENLKGQLGGEFAVGTDRGKVAGEMAALAPILFNPTILAPVVQVSAAQNHSCALYAIGRIICWGESAAGQLGLDTSVPGGGVGVMATLGYISFSDDVMAIQMDSLWDHNCALFANGRVRCWGSNAEQQLGDRSTWSRGLGSGVESVSSAVYVSFQPSIDSIPVIQVAAGSYVQN